jgi:ABC-type transport system substrate-binding protein
MGRVTADTSPERKICEKCGQIYPLDADHCPHDGTELSEADDELLGRKVGHYVLIRRLGKGAMGTVYLGLHPVIRSKVAIKVLSDKAAGDPAQVGRFITEAQAVNAIHHPNIVKISDMDRLADGRPYVLMEYLEGCTLKEYMKQGSLIDFNQVFKVIGLVMDALQAAHNAGFVHRDLKPENIFITRDGQAKLLDFGIAKLLDAPGGKVWTQRGTILGSPFYLSPEQAAGEHSKVGPSTDLYSLGVILYELYTGTVPFKGTNVYELLVAHRQQPPTPPRELNSLIPPKLEKLILWCMAKEPDGRPADVDRLRETYDEAHEEFAAGLMDTLAGTDIPTFMRRPPAAGTAATGPLPGTAALAGTGAVVGTAPADGRPARPAAAGQPAPQPAAGTGPGFLKIGLPVLAAAALLILGGVYLSREPGGGKKGSRRAVKGPSGKLVVLQHRGTEALDPLEIELTESINVVANTHEPLVLFDPLTGEAKPCLAVSWTQEANRYTFKLRPGVKFHDGSGLTAKAAAVSFNRALKTDLGRSYLWDIESVEAKGPLTLSVTLDKPSGSFLPRMSLWAAFIGKPGKPYPLGTGPYRVKSWNPQLGVVVMNANPDYWGEQPKTKTLVFRSTPDREARASMLMQGDAHVAASISPQIAVRLKKDPSLRVFKTATNVGVYLFFNTRKPYLADPKVRRALSQAVDVDGLLGVLYQDAARRATSSLPSVLAAAGVGSGTGPPPYDPHKARAVLQRAGLTQRTLKLHLYARPRLSLPDPSRAAAILVRGFRAAGLQVKAVFLPSKEFHNSCKAGEHDMALFGWIPDYPDPENIYFLLSRQGAEKGYNLALYADSVFDALLDKARREVILRKRRDLFRKLEQLLAERRPWLPLVNVADYVAVRKEVKGMRIGVEQCIGGADLFFRKAYVGK